MTLALGFAARSPDPDKPELSSVYVMADSRLTIEGKEEALDNYLKAVSLGARSAAVAAGYTIPFVLATEGARPFVAANAAGRAQRGLTPLSVWSEASFVWLHLEMLFGTFLRLMPDADVEIIIAGFFSDNTPGLIRIERRGELREILVFRPKPGERVCAVVGMPYYVPIIKEAVRRSSPPLGHGYHDVASVLWDIIKHQGSPARSIGGGISLGFCRGDQATFQWPLIEIEGKRFNRGIVYPPNPRWPAPLVLRYDPALFATLEKRHAESPFDDSDRPDTAVVAANSGVLMGDPRLFVSDWDDTWLLNEFRKRGDP